MRGVPTHNTHKQTTGPKSKIISANGDATDKHIKISMRMSRFEVIQDFEGGVHTFLLDSYIRKHLFWGIGRSHEIPDHVQTPNIPTIHIAGPGTAFKTFTLIVSHSLCGGLLMLSLGSVRVDSGCSHRPQRSKEYSDYCNLVNFTRERNVIPVMSVLKCETVNPNLRTANPKLLIFCYAKYFLLTVATYQRILSIHNSFKSDISRWFLKWHNFIEIET